MKLKDVNQRILDNLSQPILLIDRKYIIIDVNKSASTHFNLPVKKIVGQSCYKITHRCDKPCWQISDDSCPTKNAFEKKERSHVIHKHLSKDKVIVEEIVATPIYNGKYVIEEFRDITNLLGLVDGILPICASCKRIRDKEGNWRQVEGYIHDHTGTDFSHSICPECIQKLYPEFSSKIIL